MKRFKRRAAGVMACVLGFALMLGGCSAILETERMVILPHAEQHAEELADGSYLPVNYAALVIWLQNLIRSGRNEGIVMLTEYAGDRNEDVHKACVEVHREYPVGAYSIDLMYARPINRHQWKVTISYLGGRSDIDAIMLVPNAAFFEEQVRQTLRNLESRVVVETHRYNASDYNVGEIARRLFLEEPELCVPPFLPVESVYPAGGGSRRVVEVQFPYGGDRQRILDNRRQAAYEAAALLRTLDVTGAEPHDLALMIAEALWDRVTLLPSEAEPLLSEDEPFLDTSYGALVLRQPTALGLALAYKQLCDAAGIDCRVVPSERGGHHWNLIVTDEITAHIDIHAVLYGDMPPHFKLDNELRAGGYVWDTRAFPATWEEWPEPPETDEDEDEE